MLRVLNLVKNKKYNQYCISFLCSPRVQHVHHLSDVVAQICRKLFRQPIGSLVRRRWRSRLPHWWPLLLLLSTGDLGPHLGGSDPRGPICSLHARILRLLLQDLDRCVWIFGQRCKKITSLIYRSPRKFNEFIYPQFITFCYCEACVK